LVDWKGILIQILLPLLSSTLVISALTAFYNGIYNKPNLEIRIIPNEIDQRISMVDVTNNGRLPAKNILLTINTPENISAYQVINTENVTTSFTTNSTFLKLLIPRLVNGEGSMIRTIIFGVNKNIDYTRYNVYATYDEGSIKVEGLNKELTLEEGYAGFLEKWGGFIVLILLALFSITPLITSLIRKRRYSRTLYLRTYMTIIKSVYDNCHQDREQCLKHLESLQSEVMQLFKNGTITQPKFNILTQQISSYISSLKHGNKLQKKIDTY
jgi:hypothetical protein